MDGFERTLYIPHDGQQSKDAPETYHVPSLGDVEFVHDELPCRRNFFREVLHDEGPSMDHATLIPVEDNLHLQNYTNIPNN